MADARLVHDLEMAALNSVPVPRQRLVGGFLLRAFHGGTGRGNAACALHPHPDPRLAARVSDIAAHYRGQGLPPRIRSTPLDPPDLASHLVATGWRSMDETLVLAGPLRAVAREEATAWWLDGPAEEWMAVVATAEHQGPARRREKLEGAELMAIPCAWLVLDGAASIFVTADGPLCGIFDLAVRPEARRQGLARRAIGAAAAWGLARGCDTLWAQVGVANAASLALNAGLGLSEVYRYQYYLLDKG